MINIINKTRHKDLEIYYPFIEEYYRKLLKILGREDVYDLSVILVGPVTIHRINREFRSVDRATDVLSFPLQNFVPEVFDTEITDLDRNTGLLPIGDIVISVDHIRAQALEYGHSRRRELAYLLVHSVMHLLGYDHMDEGEEKRRMRRHEEAVMERLAL